MMSEVLYVVFPRWSYHLCAVVGAAVFPDLGIMETTEGFHKAPSTPVLLGRQQGRELAKSGSNKKKFNSANLFLTSIEKSGIIKFKLQTT